MAASEYAELFQDVRGEWRWRRQANNGSITAIGGESFEDRTAARKAAERENPGLEIREPED